MDSNLNKKISEQPIELPENKFLTTLKDFGTDEILAGIIDVFSTTFFSLILTESQKLFLLPFIGPITEKIMFFPAHFYQAMKIYKTLPLNKRQPFLHYFKKALKDGAGNLIKDLLIHDPMYILLMFLGLNYLPGVPAGILSFTSYVLAIFVVASIDLIRDELRFSNLKSKFKKNEFKTNTYYESRIYILNNEPKTKLIYELSKKFKLTEKYSLKYYDYYFENVLPDFLGKTKKLRIRTKVFDKNRSLSSYQIVYTLANERKKKYDQFRYFITKKEKITSNLPIIYKDINNLPNLNSTKIFKKYISPNPCEGKIEFERFVCCNPNLSICIDKKSGTRPFYILEIKARSDLKLMEKAMRYIMLNYFVVQTTHGKSVWLY